ncbi:MAG: flagellar assembly protein FliW [Peptococcaceae bacterium]
MLFKTKHFGEVEIDESRIIHFPQGIMAFEEMKKFFIIENENKDVPFAWLQSVEDGELAFVIINPFLFRPDYELDIPEAVVEELKIAETEDVAIFAIVVVPEDLKKTTANLLAPLVINTKNLLGKQIILNDKRYTTKHYLLEELKQSKGAVKDACAK